MRLHVHCSLLLGNGKFICPSFVLPSNLYNLANGYLVLREPVNSNKSIQALCVYMYAVATHVQCSFLEMVNLSVSVCKYAVELILFLELCYNSQNSVIRLE